MINVDAEVSKFKNCKDRDELIRQINGYKGLAIQSANDIVLAGKYNMVAMKLQEICDKLPAPALKRQVSSSPSAPVKTAKITKEEKKKIIDDWDKRASSRK